MIALRICETRDAKCSDGLLHHQNGFLRTLAFIRERKVFERITEILPLVMRLQEQLVLKDVGRYWTISLEVEEVCSVGLVLVSIYIISHPQGNVVMKLRIPIDLAKVPYTPWQGPLLYHINECPVPPTDDTRLLLI